jgi:hypothetical protein
LKCTGDTGNNTFILCSSSKSRNSLSSPSDFNRRWSVRNALPLHYPCMTATLLSGCIIFVSLVVAIWALFQLILLRRRYSSLKPSLYALLAFLMHCPYIPARSNHVSSRHSPVVTAAYCTRCRRRCRGNINRDQALIREVRTSIWQKAFIS